MPKAEDAARAVGGILCICWLGVGIVTIIAAKRVMRLASAPPIIYAYAPAKFALLMAIVVWVLTQVFFSLWWADPRAIVWRTIFFHTVVEGLCRPAVFGALIVHLRTPISSYLVAPNLSTMRPREHHQPFDPSPTHGALNGSGDGGMSANGGAGGDIAMMRPTTALLPPQAPSSAAFAVPNSGLKQRGDHHFGVVHRRGVTLDHMTLDSSPGPDDARDGGEEPSSSSDPAVAAAAVPMRDDATVQRHLRHLVVARSRVVLAVVLIAVWFTLHVIAAITNGVSTDDHGGIGWCGRSEEVTSLCCVPIDGYAMDPSGNTTVMQAPSGSSASAANATCAPEPTTIVRGNTTNSTSSNSTSTQTSVSSNNATMTASPNTTTAAPTTCVPVTTRAPVVIPVVVSSGFDEVKLHVVPSQVLQVAACGQDIAIAILWFASTWTYRKALISRVAVRRFTPFLWATTLFLAISAITEVPKIFTSVRQNGQAYSATLLLHEASDLIVVALIAFRAFQQRYADVSVGSVGAVTATTIPRPRNLSAG